MELVRRILFLLLSLACSHLAEAKASMRSPKARISPELEPESSKKFFDKDYPDDKRADGPIHFKHPFPVVQDSNDFDKDYVKDENSDNGAWKAQETYDRLRAKLAKEKRDVAKALATKTEEETELKEAMERHEHEEHDREEASKKVNRIRQEEDEMKRKHHQEEEAARARGEKVPHKEAQDVDAATKETEQAMRNLEDCKKQLSEAQDHLKKLMDELEEAKKKQVAADAALEEASKKEKAEKEDHAGREKTVQTEYEEYQEAKKAYAKQKAVVEKLEEEIKVSEKKVKSMRDSVDGDGGVYPSHQHKSSAAGRWLSALFLVAYCVGWA